MLSSITGRQIQEEARSTTSSFDLVRNIRVRRFRWLGEILRMHPDRLIFKSIVFQYENNNWGSLTMDVPQHNNLTHLIQLARDRTHWKTLEANIPSHLRRWYSLYDSYEIFILTSIYFYHFDSVFLNLIDYYLSIYLVQGWQYSDITLTLVGPQTLFFTHCLRDWPFPHWKHTEIFYQIIRFTWFCTKIYRKPTRFGGACRGISKTTHIYDIWCWRVP